MATNLTENQPIKNKKTSNTNKMLSNTFLNMRNIMVLLVLCKAAVLPARASEQGIVIGLVSVYSLACHTLYQLLRERKGLVTLVHVFWHCTRYFWKSHSPIRCILSHDVTSGTPTRTGPAHILIPHALTALQTRQLSIIWSKDPSCDVIMRLEVQEVKNPVIDFSCPRLPENMNQCHQTLSLA